MVRSVGVASAAVALTLGVAGNAFACRIQDFTASISCDQSNGTGKLQISDTDSTRPVTITVKKQDGTQVVAPTVFKDQGDLVLSVPWTAGTTYDVFAAVAGRFDDSKITNGSTTVPDETCTAPKASPTSAAPTPTHKAPAPAASSAAAVADTSSPSPSPSGNLAETGGSGSTGTIAGIAGALVVVGGGAVFMLRRRTASARH